jgi:hypothetical protein
MGAALTYARRYALFTVVGIAGEDDLDAPDLPTQSVPADHIIPSPPTTPAPSWYRRNGKVTTAVESKGLSVEESGRQRDRLLAELPSLGSADDAAQWAKRILRSRTPERRNTPQRSRRPSPPTFVRFDGTADPDTGAPTTDG